MQAAPEALTVSSLSLALDAAVMRQQVLASNIANAHTSGHVPQRLSFEAEMNRAWLSDAGPQRAPSLTSATMSLRAHAIPASGADETSGGFHLDREIAALAQNAAHYQTLIRGLNQHLSILMSAANDGKR